MAGKPLKDGEDDLVMNNRPPELGRDFGIDDEEDRLDRELMPDRTGDRAPSNAGKRQL